MKPLTVIAKIKEGDEHALRVTLQAINDDLDNNPYIRFSQSNRTHLARMVIISDEVNGPRLLFTVNYDGKLKAYLEELAAISPDLDGVWGKCEGYSDRQTFIKFMRKHMHRNRGYYLGFSDETVESVRAKVALRRKLEEIVDRRGFADTLGEEEIRQLLGRIQVKESWLVRAARAVSRFFGWIGKKWHAIWFPPFVIRFIRYERQLHNGLYQCLVRDSDDAGAPQFRIYFCSQCLDPTSIQIAERTQPKCVLVSYTIATQPEIPFPLFIVAKCKWL